MSRTLKVILLALQETGEATIDDLIDRLWGWDPDGGPENAVGLLRVHVHRLRRILAQRRVGIESIHGRGYRLVRLPA